MLQYIDVLLPLGGFSLCLMLLAAALLVSTKPLSRCKDIYVSVLLLAINSVLLLAGRLGFVAIELGSYESSYVLVAVLLLQSLMLLFYRAYLFSVAVIFSYVLYLLNTYDSAIFSLYLVDGLTLFLCCLVIYICKFKESQKEGEHV